MPSGLRNGPARAGAIGAKPAATAPPAASMAKQAPAGCGKGHGNVSASRMDGTRRYANGRPRFPPPSPNVLSSSTRRRWGRRGDPRLGALALGFDAVGFAPAALALAARERLQAFLDAGQHGEMGWLADRADQRADPLALWPDARSVICLGLELRAGRGCAGHAVAPILREHLRLRSQPRLP